MADLEQRLRTARPDLEAAARAAEARAEAALGIPSHGSSLAAWAGRGRRARGLWTLVGLALIAGLSTALAVSVGGGSGQTSERGEPASLEFGQSVAIGRASGPNPAPAVTVGPRGSVWVAFEQAGRIRVVSRMPNGAWPRPEAIPDARMRATEPAIAATETGELVAVWRERTAGQLRRERFTLPSGAPAGELSDVVDRRWAVRARVLADGRWGVPSVISRASPSVDDFAAPQIVAGRGDDVVVLFDRGRGAYAVEREGGERWSKPTLLGERLGTVVDARLSGDPISGRVIATWMSREGGVVGGEMIVQAAIRAPGGTWGPAERFPAGGVNSRKAFGAVNERGEALVAWAPQIVVEAGEPTLRLAARSADGRWGPPFQPLPAARAPREGLFVVEPRPLVTSDGARAVVVADGTARVAVERPDGTWRERELGGRASAVAAVPDAAGGGLLGASVFAGGPATPLERIDATGMRTGAAEPPGAGTGLRLASGLDGTSVMAWARVRPSGGAYDIVVRVAPGVGGAG